MPNRAIAYSNNDVAFIAWQYENAIPNCLGFSIHRIDQKGKETVLPAWVGFRGQDNQDWHPNSTDVWPIQKFSWRDLTAKRGEKYVYKIIPMIGTSEQLSAPKDQSLILTTDQIDLTSDRGNGASVYFNRGILSTQALAHKIPSMPSGVPNYKILTDRIDQPGDALRNDLAGQMIEALSSLLKRAKKEGGHCYCALYELNDPELLKLLLSLPKQVHIILSNTGTDDGTNQGSRQSLHEAGVDVTDRMLPSGHIGHNKFMVYVDDAGRERAVLTGSTNWTVTGICAQSNNAIMIEDASLAKAYLEYWNRLKTDDADQGSDFRQSNMTPIEVNNGSAINLWFSPNTKQKNKPAHDAPTPVDMDEVFNAINGAKEGILFLVFQPGTPSIVDEIVKTQNAKPELFVRGAATDPKAVDDFNTQLYHRPGQAPDEVVAATEIKDQFSYWEKELLKLSPTCHAIIHDKIVVIDPFTDNCVVITGSHNLGFRASYNNDENLLIIRGNRKLAEAYAVHVSDVYDHYRWRYTLQHSTKAWNGLENDDSWQKKYFDQDYIKNEINFWL